MECQVGGLTMSYEEVGTGRPLLLLHGWPLDHRHIAHDMEPLFAERIGWRRLYPDLPGMGKTRAADWITQQDGMLDLVLAFIDTATLYEMTSRVKERSELAQATGMDSATLDMLAMFADLMRVQWVSPTFARMLILAGYDSAVKVATANADDLCEALANINARAKFYKGTIGLRDIKRLVHAASYV